MLANAAGDCLNEKQCRQCAGRVREHASSALSALVYLAIMPVSLCIGPPFFTRLLTKEINHLTQNINSKIISWLLIMI